MSGISAAAGAAIAATLNRVLAEFNAESGTVHLLGDDGVLHLAANQGIPDMVLEKVRTVVVGKGMAGLAVERREPVNTCNLQTDNTGDVRPGARATGLRGAVAVPIFNDAQVAVGALGIGVSAERNFSKEELNRIMNAARALAPFAVSNGRAA